MEQAYTYAASQVASKTERNQCGVVLLSFEGRGFLIPGCFGVAKLDAARIELSS